MRPHQTADVIPARNIDVLQPHLTQRCATGVAKQADKVCGSPVNKQATDHMPQPIKHALETIAVSTTKRIKPRTAVPACGGAGINIRAQHIVAGQPAVDGLQGVYVGNDGVVNDRTSTAQLGAEAAGGGQIDGRRDPVLGFGAVNHPIAAALTVFQRQAGSAAGVQGFIDVDITLGAECEGVVVPADAVINENIAVAVGVAIDALNLDVGAGQLIAQRSAGDVTAAGRDGEVVGIDQPAAGVAMFRLRGDLCAVGNRDVSTAGFDKAAIAAGGR